MKNIQNLKFIIILYLFTVTITGSLYAQISVKNGVIDIKNTELDEKVINLKGYWEFYESELYTPEDFKNKKVIKPEYIIVPGLWNNIKKNKSGSGQGFGTYRIKILNTEKDKLYALNLNRIQSSYKIWVNGKLLREEGTTGKDKAGSKPRWSSSDIIFKASGDTSEIILQVSNFYHKKGGIEHPVIFGKEKAVYEYGWKRISWNFLLLGIFMIMIVYHLAAFLFRRNDKSNLYFSLTLVFSALFSLTVGEILLMDFFPSLNWEILIKTNYISNYLRALFFALFIYSVFPEELNKLFVKILTFTVTGIIIFILVTPAIVYTKTLIVFLIIAGIVLIYLMIGQVKAIIKKRPGAIYSFAGVLVLIGTAVNDILKELQIIDSVSLTIFGIFIFIILHSYLITLQNAFSYKTIRRITKNIGIRGKVKDALFSARSYDLKEPLKAISEVVDADRALIFIYSDNDWTATNEYLKKTDTAKITKIKVFSGKENTYFSSYNIQRTISSKEYTYTIVNEAVKAKDMKYLEGSGIYSILSYPLIKDGVVSGLLYFENYSEKKDFEKLAVGILEDIKPQVLVFMDNFTSYNNLKKLNIKLEKDVDAKIREIEAGTDKLKKQRENLAKQNAKISETSKKLEKQTEQINDGINYSEKIQKALIHDKNKLTNFFPESFIYHYTGDKKLFNTFFWFNKINDDEIVYASVKSKSSGISGTLISVLTNQLLNDVVIYQKNYSPKIILNQLQEKFEKFPENTGAVDIAVIYYNKKKREILFSGANNSVFYSYDNSFIEYVSSKSPVEKHEENIKRFYSNKRITVSPESKMFILTGVLDFTDDNYEIYKQEKEKIIRNLLDISDKNNEEREEILKKTASEKQTDDFLITGIKF